MSFKIVPAVINEKSTPFFLPKNNKNYIEYKKKKYSLINYHIHCSSENTIDGLYYPVEVHFVNKFDNLESSQSEYFVISLMLLLSNKVGLNIVNLDYEKIKNQGDEIDIVVNLDFLNDLTLNSYYNFKGTLTVPPFIQNVNWNLFDSKDIINIPLNISESDFNNLIYYFSNNKANDQSLYNETRYIKDDDNYAVITRIL